MGREHFGIQQARRRACGAGPSSERGGVFSTHPHALGYDAIQSKTTRSFPQYKRPYAFNRDVPDWTGSPGERRSLR